MAAQGDIYRVAVRMYGTANQDFINVYHVQLGTYVTGDDEDVALELVTDITDAYQDWEPSISPLQLSNDISIVNLTTSAVLGTWEWTTTFQGTGSGDPVPPQSSVFCYMRTGVSRRIGRKFMGVTTESLQSNGLAAAAIYTSATAFLAKMIADFVGGTTGNTYQYGIYNDEKSPTFLQFLEGVVVGRLMTQKRRRPTVGS